MPVFGVEVFVDEEQARVYNVTADTKDEALTIACEHVRNLIGGEVSDDSFNDADGDLPAEES